MLTARDLSHGLYGAWRLARLDTDAIKYFDVSIEAFWKSFYAAAIVAPVFVLVTIRSLAGGEPSEHAGLFEIVVIEAAGYVIYWTAFPLLMVGVSDLLQRGERYLGYIIAFNWAQVVEQAVFLPALLLSFVSGSRPDEADPVLTTVFFAVTFYYWFIARTALQISGWAAGAVVLLNHVLTIFIELTVQGLLRQ
jgi:hypothetical protein